jgi:hypothetical protein
MGDGEMSEKKTPTDDNHEFEFYDETRTESKKLRNKYGDEFKLVTIKDFTPWESPSDIKEKDPIRKPRKDAKWNVPPEAYQLIYDFLPEFDRIWNAIRALPGSLKDSTDKGIKWAAIQCFDNFSDWKYLTGELLKKPYVWDWRSGHERSDFRGKLLETLFGQHLPAFQPGYRTLEEIARSFKTDQI